MVAEIGGLKSLSRLMADYVLLSSSAAWGEAVLLGYQDKGLEGIEFRGEHPWGHRERGSMLMIQPSTALKLYELEPYAA